MIPKIIHYCWFGGKPLGEDIQKYIETWRKYCPDYIIKEWNEGNFDINSNTYVKEAYEEKKWAFITDYVRLYALYHEGGIYMDTDVELLKPIDTFLSFPAFSGFEDEKQIPTAIMGSEKHGEWVGYLLSYYDNRHFRREDGTLDITTNVITITEMTKRKYPVVLDNTFQKPDGKFVLFPKDYFCPKSYNSGKIELTKNTHCIHHFKGSWQEEDFKKNHELRIKYKRLFGRKVGGKVSDFIILAKRKDGSLKKAILRFLRKKFGKKEQ